MNETAIQNNIRKELSKYGVVLRLNNGMFTTPDGRIISSGLPRGVSDLLFIGKGKVAFIETKSANGHATKEQINFINKMRELGHIAGIARSVREACEMIGEEYGNND